jgi:hypothetical protein
MTVLGSAVDTTQQHQLLLYVAVATAGVPATLRAVVVAAAAGEVLRLNRVWLRRIE